MALKKPPHMDSYNGITDPDEHIKNMEVILDYHRVKGPIKCCFFASTLNESASTWLKGLPLNYIDSWEEFYKKFVVEYTTSQKQSKTIETLSTIDYIECFNKEVVFIKEENYNMKMYLIKEALHEGSYFSDDIGLKKSGTMNCFLA